jgi:hypothetical protein
MMADSTHTHEDTDPRVAVYRHDVHKLQGRAHEHAQDTYAGVPVNEAVPHGADGDVAMLSRPAESPEQTVPNHATPHRLALTSGQTAATTPQLDISAEGAIDPLVTPTDPIVAHARWLTSPIPAAYNESAYYPYSSLQYHTLLTGALLDAYLSGHDFDDLSLVATQPALDGPPTLARTRDPEAALDADIVEPHRTVLWTPACALHITPEPGDRPATRLGSQPARSFADTWSHLPEHPIDTDGAHRWRLLDAQLRRIRAYSTALAYIDDYVSTYGLPDNEPDREPHR